MVETKHFIPQPDLPEDVIDFTELQRWRASLKPVQASMCPTEVRDFIEAMARSLGDFGRVRTFRTWITGYELQLSGMREINGRPINRYTSYPLDVPEMQAVDHRTSMHRIYARRGKQGLIDYVKARLQGKQLLGTLDVLNVHVFHQQDRPEFKAILAQIEKDQTAAR